jgi:hypothetical protein
VISGLKPFGLAAALFHHWQLLLWEGAPPRA